MKHEKTKKLLIVLALITMMVTFAFFSFIPVKAATAAINPVADSYVYDNAGSNRGNNYGTSATLRVEDTNTVSYWFYKERAYLKFDLNSLPAGAVITQAYLRLHKNTGGSTISPVYSVSDDTWTESGITWDGMPAPGSQLSTATSESSSWYRWDITSYANSEFGTTNKLLSVVIKTAETGNSASEVRFDSKEASGTTNDPKLDIIYTPDTTKPSSSASVNDYQTSRTFSVSYTASDANSGVASVQLYYRYGTSGSFSATGSPGSGTSGSISFTATQDGIVQFYTRATDSASNVEDAPASPTFDDSTIIDTVAPTGAVSISSGAAYATSTGVTLSLTYTDGSGSGVKDVRYSNDGVWDAEIFESASGTKVWTLSSGDGTKTVYYQVRDNALQTSATYSDTIVLDTAAPSVSVHAPSGLIATAAPTIQVSASDTGGSGVSTVTVSIDGGASHAAALNGAYYEYSASGLGQGAHTVTATATDIAGNSVTSSPTTSFTVDTVASNLVISSPSEGLVHVTAVPVSGTASDSSGIASVQWQVDSTSGSWTTATGTTSWSFTTGTLSQGAHTIYVKATDGIGNTQTTSVAITVQSIFAITVTQAVSGHGIIAPETTDVNYDGGQDFTITPESGYHIASVTVDGSSAPATSPYTFSNVVATHTITASFAINTYAITVTQAAHGTIAGPSYVNWGTDAAYTIAPANGYSIVEVVVDGISQGAVTSATISNVKETGHSITASYALTIHSTVLTISVDPKIANKYDSPHATVSGTLKSEGTGLNLQTVIVSYNDGRNGWIECGHPTTDANGYYTVDFPVTPDFANGFVAFEAKFAGDAGSGYAAATPVHTGAIGEEEGNLNVLPEYIFGGLAAIGACFVGFVAFKKRSSLPKFSR